MTDMFADYKIRLFVFYRHYIVLFLKFTLLLALIGLFERGVFAYYHHHLISPYSTSEVVYTLLWGLRFDFALAGFFALLAFLLGYLLKRFFGVPQAITLKYFALVAGSIIFILQGADILYFSDAARHLGYEITDTFNDAPYLLNAAWTRYKLPLVFHLLVFPLLLYFIYLLFSTATGNDGSGHERLTGLKRLHVELVYILLILFAVVLIRGGLQSIPLEPLQAQEISDPAKANLALNGAYNALFYLFSKHIVNRVPVKVPPSLDVENTIKQLYQSGPAQLNKSQLSKQGTWQPNIIFIFLESWPAMYMNSYGYDKLTTPFFDELRQKSLTTAEMIAGGHRTTEGLFATLCSAQNPLGQTIARSQLQDYTYRCLPHILRDAGYRTAFFQGSNRNTSGTGVFAQLLGYSESYGKADIEERRYHENGWGVYDQDLYDYVYQALKNNEAPVFFGINTNTTHDVVLPPGVIPRFVPGKSDPRSLNALSFADSALKDFFNKVESDPDIGDTLWVVFADHTAGLTSSRLNNYRIPFLIYNKGSISAQHIDRVASQRDIAPTVLDLMNMPIPEYFSGKSLLRSDNAPYFASYYHSGILGWIEDGYLVEIPLADPEQFSCYDYSADKLQNNKLPCPPGARKNRNRALAFTETMQTRLFTGQSTSRIY